MLNRFIHRFIRPRHFWRNASFDELAEIYTSMGLRSFGFGIIGIFVPVYLFKLDYSLPAIFVFYLCFFAFRIPLSFIDGWVVGKIGPKHGIAISTLLFVVFLSALLTLELVGWPLWFLALLFTITNGLFFISYHTDFSKIKDTKHSGKELGWLYIFERFGSALGPLVGGLIATFLSPQITILCAIIVLLISLIPLFMTNEPVKVHQHITYKNFPWRRHRRDFVSFSAFHVENVASSALWPLLIAVSVFVDDTYAKLGGITALAMMISIVSARAFGKFIDKKSGSALLNYGVLLNVLLHIGRVFSLNPTSAVLVSVTNEPVTLSYRMPYMKGYYDAADSEQGYRIAYLVLQEVIASFAKSSFILGLLVASMWFNAVDVLRWSYLAVAVLSLGILLQRYPALKKV